MEGHPVYIFGFQINVLHIAVAIWLLLTIISAVVIFYKHCGGSRRSTKDKVGEVLSAAMGLLFLCMAVFGIGGLIVLFSVPTTMSESRLEPLPGKSYYIVSHEVGQGYPSVTLMSKGKQIQIDGTPSVYYSKDEKNPRIEKTYSNYRVWDRLYGLDSLGPEPTVAIYVPAVTKNFRWFQKQKAKIDKIDAKIAKLDSASKYSDVLPDVLLTEQRRLNRDKIHALAVDRDIDAGIYNAMSGTASEADFYRQFSTSTIPYYIPLKYRDHWSMVTTPTP